MLETAEASSPRDFARSWRNRIRPFGTMRSAMRSSLFLGLGLGALALSPALAAGHTVTVNTVQIFGTVDPAKISDYTDYMASANLYDGLANVDSTGNLVPELAEKWDISPDATSVTFHIRADAKFQDGSPVTAEDVVY